VSTILEKIYEKSPSLIQNLMVSGYGLKIYRREYGRKFHAALKEFEERQWWSAEKLRDYQNEKLRALIKHSYENVPFYKNKMNACGIRPDDIKSVDDLALIPILTRDDVKANFDDLVARNYKRSQLIMGHTSGTTGSPLEFLYDRWICLIKNVFDWRVKNDAGIKLGDKLALFLGRMVVPISRSVPPFWRWNYIFNHLYFSSFHMSAGNLRKYVEQLKRFRPLAVEGYPSTIYIIARYLISQSMTFPVRAVFTSSETLLPIQREAIENAFACKIFDFYGLAERVAFASECSCHEGHHINTDFGITEILDGDGNRCSPGQLGRIVATGFHNYGMPLIRYKTSDLSSLREKRCSCGRQFPLMEDVTTKAEDIITTPDGRYISSSILTHPFKPMHSVAESQIIQEDREHIRIKLVVLSSYTDADAKYLLNELGKRLGGGMKIEVELVDSIPRTAAGKFRWVISKVPLEL